MLVNTYWPQRRRTHQVLDLLRASPGNGDDVEPSLASAASGGVVAVAADLLDAPAVRRLALPAGEDRHSVPHCERRSTQAVLMFPVPR